MLDVFKKRIEKLKSDPFTLPTIQLGMMGIAALLAKFNLKEHEKKLIQELHENYGNFKPLSEKDQKRLIELILGKGVDVKIMRNEADVQKYPDVKILFNKLSGSERANLFFGAALTTKAGGKYLFLPPKTNFPTLIHELGHLKTHPMINEKDLKGSKFEKMQIVEEKANAAIKNMINSPKVQAFLDTASKTYTLERDKAQNKEVKDILRMGMIGSALHLIGNLGAKYLDKKASSEFYHYIPKEHKDIIQKEGLKSLAVLLKTPAFREYAEKRLKTYSRFLNKGEEPTKQNLLNAINKFRKHERGSEFIYGLSELWDKEKAKDIKGTEWMNERIPVRILIDKLKQDGLLEYSELLGAGTIDYNKIDPKLTFKNIDHPRILVKGGIIPSKYLDFNKKANGDMVEYYKKHPLKVIYHGTPKNIKQITPQNKHGDPDLKGNLVFGTPDKTFALPYAGKKWSDLDLSQTFITDKKTGKTKYELMEMRPNAFKDLFKNKSGFIHQLAADTFKKIEGRRDDIEQASTESSKSIKIEKIKDVLKALKQSDTKLTPFDPNNPEYLKAINRRVKRMSKMTPEKKEQYINWVKEEGHPTLVKAMFKKKASLSKLAATIKELAPKLLSQPAPYQARAVSKFMKNPEGLIVAHGTGTGKTFTSILSAIKAGNPVEAVVPAPLVENYKKELIKHLGEIPSDVRIRSYEKVIGDPTFTPNSTLILDEAHRVRNPYSKRFQSIFMKNPAFAKKLLLTASPTYNTPHDMGSLINILKGKEVVPFSEHEFDKKFITKKVKSPGFFARHLLGIKPGIEKELKSKRSLKGLFKNLVDIHYNPEGNTDFPQKITETVKVPMHSEQQDIYNYVVGKHLPFWLKYKIERNLPLTKKESNGLNAFLTGARQVVNAPHLFSSRKIESPKVMKIIDSILEGMKNNPRYKSIVYSNFLEGGLNMVKDKLKRLNIPHASFTGQESKSEKKKIVEAYNTGKLPVMLVSSSGTEGLDTKGTREIHVMEPHFNLEKIKQIEGRGIRYKSHEHLPEEERKVNVKHYLATEAQPSSWLGRVFRSLRGRKSTVDEYLYDLARKKDALNQEFLNAIQKVNTNAI